MGLSVAATVAEDGGVPMMSGMRIAGKELGVPAAAAPAAFAATVAGLGAAAEAP